LCGEELGEAGQAQAAGEPQQLLCGEEAVAFSEWMPSQAFERCQATRFMSAGMLEAFALTGPVIIGPQGLLRTRGAG